MFVLSSASTIDMRETSNSRSRRFLLKLLESIRYLAKQGVPFRGHHEDGTCFKRNLYQLLLLQAHEESGMQQWPKRREYISPQIVNELIVLMGLAVS